MIAVENIELYRYEIHSLLKAFYPRETVKVFVGEPDVRKYPDPAFLRVGFEENFIEMKLMGEGSPEADRDAGEGPAMVRRIEAPAGTVYNVKSPECKTAAKHMLYEMLSEYTGTSLPWGELIGIRPTKIAMSRLKDGDTPEEAALYMQREHLVSREKAELAAEIAQRERKILSGIHYENGYSLYVGIPFCPTTCLYCSFTSFPLASWRDRVDEYLDALEREMEASAPLMEGKIRRPDSINAEKLEVLKRCGVGRISVNPQTMRDRTLKLIGRQHSAGQTEDAFRLAREAGFDNINMDIILGLPGETQEDVQYTIDEIKALGPDDLTVHSLAVKRASRLQKWIEKNGFSSINNTDESMKIAARGAADMGMHPYYLYRQKNMSGNFENVGYAADGKAGIYNILIMEEKQSILALGAGSISKGVFPGGRIERCDDAKEVAVYIANIEEMIERKRKLYGQ